MQSSRRTPRYNLIPSHRDESGLDYSTSSYPSSRDPSPAPPYDPPHALQHASAHCDINYNAYEQARPMLSNTVIDSHPANAPSSRLPFFEAALARTRTDHRSHDQTPQPLPAYLPAIDPNHPSLMVNVTQTNTPHFIANDNPYSSFARGLSRSPSPDVNHHYSRSSPIWDIEKASMIDASSNIEKLLWLRGHEHLEEEKYEADISQYSRASPFPTAPAIHVQVPSDASSGTDLATGHLLPSLTQHFGPAPTGRVGRRTHNAAGPRRIKQTATLDENGFFAVEMPIPTRLAQFLPVKGVEEQKSTR